MFFDNHAIIKRFGLLWTLALLPLCLLTGCKDGPKGGDDPKALNAQGWVEYQLGEAKRAIGFFDQARTLAQPGSEDYLQATFGLATTWNLRQPQTDQDKALARQYYQEIMETASDHDLAAWSHLSLARMLHLVPVGEEPDYDVVRNAYQEVVDRYPNHLAGHEAFLYQQATYVQTLKQEAAAESLARLERFMADHPNTRFASLAYELISRSHQILKQYDQRLEAEIKAFEKAEVDPTSPFQDNAFSYWRIATVAEFEAGDFDVARKYYRLLIEEYPTDQKTFASQQAIERMDALEARLRKEQSGPSSNGEAAL